MFTTCFFKPQIRGNIEETVFRAKDDAEAVRILREAGAIPLVVSNVPECCLWMETFNNVHGRTNNPYDTRRTSGGSSGGEGALVGAGASVIGLASDTAGQTRVIQLLTREKI